MHYHAPAFLRSVSLLLVGGVVKLLWCASKLVADTTFGIAAHDAAPQGDAICDTCVVSAAGAQVAWFRIFVPCLACDAISSGLELALPAAEVAAACES